MPLQILPERVDSVYKGRRRSSGIFNSMMEVDELQRKQKANDRINDKNRNNSNSINNNDPSLGVYRNIEIEAAVSQSGQVKFSNEEIDASLTFHGLTKFQVNLYLATSFHIFRLFIHDSFFFFFLCR